MHRRRHTPHARHDRSGAMRGLGHSTGLMLHGPPWGPLHRGVPHATPQGRSIGWPGGSWPLRRAEAASCSLGPVASGVPHATRQGRSIGSPEESWPFHRAKDALSSLGPDALEKGLTTRLTRSMGSMRGPRPFLHRLCSIVLPDARCFGERTLHTPQTILREILAYTGLSRLPRCLQNEKERR